MNASRLKILYFASARDAARTRSEEVDVDVGTTVQALAAALRHMHPELSSFQDSIRFSVNKELVPSDTRLNDGDRVAVLPAVTGG